ncbi:MAG: uroporphyrinogen decarboxylase family protein [Thermoguttaceae bacterium]
MTTINMTNWIAGLISSPKRAALPIMTSPGIPLIGATPVETFQSGLLQFKAIKALNEQFPLAAALTMMDLSVEAEAFGSPIQFNEKENPTVAGTLVHDLAEIEQLPIPKIGTARTSECLLTAKYLASELKERPTLGGLIGPFSLAGRLFDMSKMMLYTAMEPAWVHALLEKVTQFLIDYAKAFKATGCHGLIMAEPAAGLVSPKMSQEFSANYIKRVVDAVKDDHFTFILHNCGKTEKMVPVLLSTGASSLHVGNAVDITKILSQVPKDVPIMGNLDPSGVFLLGTAEEVYAKTFELLESTKEFPNYVLSSGCDVPPGTSLENVKAFFDALSAYNKTV